MPNLRPNLVVKCATLIAVSLLSQAAHAESWQMVMKNKDGSMSWIVDEKLGVLMSISSQPNIEMLLRTDLKQTIYVNRKRGMHAVQRWGAANSGGVDIFGGMTKEQRERAERGLAEAREKLKNLPPEARKLAEGVLAGKIKGALPGKSAAVITYKDTGMKKKIGKFQTTRVIKLANGPPTGDQLWVARIKDWERIAKVLDYAYKNSKQTPNQDLAFSQLKGIPIRMVDRRGLSTNLVSLKRIAVKKPQMSVGSKSKETPLMDFMRQVGTSKQKRSGR